MGGIREHAMGAILNGLSFYGLFRPSGSTFLVFSDYMRSSVRVAALSHIPVGYIWTHDSIGVGEDGPTHQPVETVSSLRLIPNLNVQRPGDAEETAGSYIHGMNHKTGPTAYILSRHRSVVQVCRQGARRRHLRRVGPGPAHLREEGHHRGQPGQGCVGLNSPSPPREFLCTRGHGS